MTPRARKTWASIAAASVTGAALALAVLGACLSTDPILVVPGLDSGQPAPVTMDAGLDARADVDLRTPCERCIESPDDAATGGCLTELTRCETNPKCALTYECAIRFGCLTLPTRRDVVNCGIPCAEEAGIVTQIDPAVTLVLGVTDCVTRHCSSACIPDAAPP